MKGAPILYSPAELAFIEQRSAIPRRDLHAAFLKAFPRTEVSQANLTALCKRKGWLTGRTGRFVPGQVAVNKGKRCPEGVGGRHPNARKSQFKKGHEPHNTKYLGHERVSVDGYVEISIAETNPHTGYGRRYVLKHVHLWEAAKGPIPDGHCLKCLDGDKTNTDPSNWEVVPRALLPRLNGRFGRGYDEAPAALKPAIMAVAKLEHAARSRREKGKP